MKTHCEMAATFSNSLKCAWASRQLTSIRNIVFSILVSSIPNIICVLFRPKLYGTLTALYIIDRWSNKKNFGKCFIVMHFQLWTVHKMYTNLNTSAETNWKENKVQLYRLSNALYLAQNICYTVWKSSE